MRYRRITIDGKRVYEHRYVMEQHLGRPLRRDEEVDHINGDTRDNRIENLRVCTRAQNAQNMRGGRGRSRHRGVTWHKKLQRWQAQVMLAGRNHYLGLFDDEDEAAQAAADFRREKMTHATT